MDRGVVENRKKLPCPKMDEFLATPYSSSISAKIRLYGYFLRFWPIILPNGTPLAPRWTLGGPHRANSRILADGGDPPGSILGPMGSHLGKKNGSKTVKNTMPQNTNFRLPRAHRFRPKFDFTVMVPNHGGDPLGSILGPMGSSLGPKNGSKP